MTLASWAIGVFAVWTAIGLIGRPTGYAADTVSAIGLGLAKRRLAAGPGLGEHSLIFSNKTPADVICEKELRARFGDRCILTCTEQRAAGYANRRIDRTSLVEWVRGSTSASMSVGHPIS